MQRRLKREDCKHTKHDSVFSKWEILIGPNDWEDHASCKNGVERYRIHNLPAASSCSGLYELGVASIPSIEGNRHRKIDCDDVIAVYLGQADNVRTRLQEYGRSGSHLDANIIARHKIDKSSYPKEGPGLFKDIFSKGCSITFRWAPIKSKLEAEKTEIELLLVFDYAWNRKGNGVCRHADILAKLIKYWSNTYYRPLRKLMQWKQNMFNKSVGIHIDSYVPIVENAISADGRLSYLLPRILKFSSSKIQILPQHGFNSVNDQILCGVAIGYGSVCANKPLPGRKRCGKHKGKKITGSALTSQKLPASLTQEDASISATHKDRIITSPILDEICSSLAREKCYHGKEGNGICGVIYGDGCVCRRSPVLGRKRCELHKGQRVIVSMRSSLNTNVCGVIDGNGNICSRPPFPGRKRCEEHKGRRIVAAANINASWEE